MTPLLDPNRLSPTGRRLQPIPDDDQASAQHQRNQDIRAAYLRLESEVTLLRDTVSERDAEIDTLRSIIADDDDA